MAELYGEDGEEEAGNPFENPGSVIEFPMFVDVEVELFVFPPQYIFEDFNDNLDKGLAAFENSQSEELLVQG